MTGKAIILVGGGGSRLRPLTDVRPKPNVYLGSRKRLLEYDIDLFVNAGYYDLVLAVEYMSDKIMNYFRDGSHFIYKDDDGVEKPLRIKYAQAPAGQNMVGTADAVRKSRLQLADALVVKDFRTQEPVEITTGEYLKSPENYHLQRYVENFNYIVVGSGDILTNADLQPIIDFHKQKSGVATIGFYDMHPGNIVNKFGIAEIDDHGRVKRFAEKPKKKEDIFANHVNASVYVFDRSILDILEENKEDMLDFGKHVFPFLLSKYPDDLYGYVFKGYWNDLGTIESYRKTSMELIDGLDGISSFSRRERPQEDGKVVGVAEHSLIGRGSKVESGAFVKDCVIGDESEVGKNTRLNGCVMFPNSRIDNNIEASGLILDRGVHVHEGARIGNNVPIGSGTVIKKGAVIHPGVRIGQGEVITDDVSEDILRER